MGLSEDFKKFLTGRKNKVREQGQAVIEYILLLIIIVSIILGVLYQFNDAFKNFLQSYFGDYIACLLETGELPSLGGNGGPNQGICNAKFKNFNVSNGRPILDPATNRNAPEISGISGSNSGSENSEDNKEGAKNSSSSQNPPLGKSPSLRPRRFNRTNAPTNGDTLLSSDRPKRQRLNFNQSSLEKNSRKENSEKTTLGTGTGRGRRIVRRRVMVLDEEYFTKDEKKKKEKTINAGKTVKNNGESVSNLRKPRFDLELPEPPKPPPETKDFQLSIGFFLKFLIIAGIVIAIFLFLGGQILQIKKSWEK